MSRKRKRIINKQYKYLFKRIKYYHKKAAEEFQIGFNIYKQKHGN